MMLMRFKTSLVVVAVSFALLGQIAWGSYNSPSLLSALPDIPEFVPGGQTLSAEETAQIEEFEDLLVLANGAVNAKLESARSQLTTHHAMNWIALMAIGLITLLCAIFRVMPYEIYHPHDQDVRRSPKKIFTLLTILGAVTIASQAIAVSLETHVIISNKQAESINLSANNARAAFIESTSKNETLQALDALKNTVVDDAATEERIAISSSVGLL